MVIALLVNIVAGAAVCESEMSIFIKIALIIAVAVKCGLFLYLSLFETRSGVRNAGCVLCAVVDLSGGVCAALHGVWTAGIAFGAALFLLICWSIFMARAAKKGANRV